MENYIISVNKHKDAIHTLVKFKDGTGFSIIQMIDEEGINYNIASIKYTGLEDQYELVNEFTFVIREYDKVENFVNSFISN